MNPVTIRGVSYPSQAAAARALGTSAQNVQERLAAGKPDSIGAGRSGNNKRPVTYKGVTYNSRKELANALGVGKRKLYSMLKRNPQPKKVE